MKRSSMIRVLALAIIVAVGALMVSGCAPAAATTAADGTGAAASAAGGGISMIIMMVVLIAVFYFFMIRPENKRKKKAQEMRDNLSVGDTITTIGGIVGKIVNVKDNAIVIETSEDRARSVGQNHLFQHALSEAEHAVLKALEGHAAVVNLLFDIDIAHDRAGHKLREH